MSKRLSRWMAATLAALIVGAFAVDWVRGQTLTSSSFGSMESNQRGTVTVTGDSTTYYLYDALLPCPRHDTTGTAGDLYAAYCSDTLVFGVEPCDKISIYGRWDGDSVAYWVDQSFDGVTWTAVIGSTFVNGTPSRTWTPLATDWSQKVHTQLSHAVSTETYFDAFMWKKLRIRMLNMDADSIYVDGSPTAAYGDNAAADTTINIRWIVDCGH